MTAVSVLLAEDDDELRWVLTGFLEAEGFRVHAVTNGFDLLAEAAARIEQGLPPAVDAIVTDVRMPGFHIWNILAGLFELGCAPRLVVMSAFGDDDTRRRAGAVGAVFLRKPFDPAALVSALKVSHEGQEGTTG